MGAHIKPTKMLLCSLPARLRPTQALFQSRSFRRVPAKDAIKTQASTQGVTFIDVRHSTQQTGNNILPAGFKRIPHYSLEMELNAGNLPPNDQPVYLADTWGFHAERCARVLEQRGFTDVCVISGGIVSWGSNGGPVDVTQKDALQKKYNCKFVCTS